MQGWEQDRLSVAFGGHRVQLSRCRLGQGTQLALILAGVHGGEHTGVAVAWGLMEEVTAVRRGWAMEVLPICNPTAFRAGTRTTPEDGRDLGNAFGRQVPATLSEALATALATEARRAALVLDLRADGEARQAQHALYHWPEAAQVAAAAGLDYTLARAQGTEGREATLAGLLGPSVTHVTLELGGEMLLWPEDVRHGLRAVRGILDYVGAIERRGDEPPPTPQERRLAQDPRQLVASPADGAFYRRLEVGDLVQEGTPLGILVTSELLAPQPILAPSAGRIVYLRARCQVEEGETLAMLIPG